MQIWEIMTPSVETIDLYASLREAARKMESEDIGFLPVLNDGELVGVITDRDIIVRAVARGFDPEVTTVEETMTTDVVSISESSAIEQAADLMTDRHVRRLVITDDDNLPVGVVSMARVASYLGVTGLDDAALRDTREFSPDFEPNAFAATRARPRASASRRTARDASDATQPRPPELGGKALSRSVQERRSREERRRS